MIRERLVLAAMLVVFLMFWATVIAWFLGAFG